MVAARSLALTGAGPALDRRDLTAHESRMPRAILRSPCLWRRPLGLPSPCRQPRLDPLKRSLGHGTRGRLLGRLRRPVHSLIGHRHSPRDGGCELAYGVSATSHTGSMVARGLPGPPRLLSSPTRSTRAPAVHMPPIEVSDIAQARSRDQAQADGPPSPLLRGADPAAWGRPSSADHRLPRMSRGATGPSGRFATPRSRPCPRAV